MPLTLEQRRLVDEYTRLIEDHGEAAHEAVLARRAGEQNRDRVHEAHQAVIDFFVAHALEIKTIYHENWFEISQWHRQRHRGPFVEWVG